MIDDEKNIKKVILVTLSALAFIALVGMLMTFLQSCTYSINMVHSQGQADDVIDETSSNAPDISPKVSLPLTP